MASSTDEEALNTIITEVKEEHTTYAVYVAPAPDSSDFTVPEALEVIQSHAVWPIESVLPTKSVNTTEVTATYVPVTTSEGGDVIGHVLPLALHTFERPNTSLLVITFGKDLSAAINISHFSKLPSSVVIRVLSATKPATIRAADTATLTDIAARIQSSVDAIEASFAGRHSINRLCVLCLWTPATARPTQVAITRRLANIFTATTPAQAQDDGDSAETGRKLSTSVPQVLFYCGSVDTREAAMAASSSSTETNGILYGSTQHQENVWELTGPNFTHAEHAALAAIGIGGPTLRLHYECSKDGDDNTETFDFLVDKSVGMTCNIYGNATISNIDQAIADEICKSAPKAPEGSADFSVLRISGVDSRTFILFLFAAFLPPPSCVWVRNTSTGVFVQVNLKQGESAMQFREVDTEGTRNSLLQAALLTGYNHCITNTLGETAASIFASWGDYALKQLAVYGDGARVPLRRQLNTVTEDFHRHGIAGPPNAYARYSAESVRLWKLAQFCKAATSFKPLKTVCNNLDRLLIHVNLGFDRVEGGVFELHQHEDTEGGQEDFDGAAGPQASDMPPGCNTQ